VPWLWHRKSSLGRTVWIAERLLPAMEADAAEHAPCETGGMLLGYWSPSGDVVVTETIPCGPNSVHERSRFEPDGKWQQTRLDELYFRSGRITTYLGDWHSHPSGGLRPSGRDRSTAKAIAKTGDARAPHPLTVIAIEASDRWWWGVFRYRGRRGFERLELKRYELQPDEAIGRL
jgi:integrative and conjugative element protein (TIGR02256 family)